MGKTVLIELTVRQREVTLEALANFMIGLEDGYGEGVVHLARYDADKLRVMKAAYKAITAAKGKKVSRRRKPAANAKEYRLRRPDQSALIIAQGRQKSDTCQVAKRNRRQG